MAQRDEITVAASADRGVVFAGWRRPRAAIDNIGAPPSCTFAERALPLHAARQHIKARLDLPPADRIARPARSSACACWRLPPASTPISPRSSWASWSAESSYHEDIKARYDELVPLKRTLGSARSPGIRLCARPMRRCPERAVSQLDWQLNTGSLGGIDGVSVILPRRRVTRRRRCLASQGPRSFTCGIDPSPCHPSSQQRLGCTAHLSDHSGA